MGEKLDIIDDNPGDGVSDIATDLIGNQSEVQPHAVEAERAKTAAGEAPPENSEQQRDIVGTIFDPLKHASDAGGKPSVTKTGRYRKKTIKSNDPSIVRRPGDAAQGKQESSQPTGAHDAALAVVATIEMLGQVIGGDEWRYIKNDEFGINERGTGIQAFEAYFVQKGVADFPPGIALFVWSVGYILPRFTMPKTQSRMQRFGNWLKIKFLSRKIKKAPPDTEKREPE